MEEQITVSATINAPVSKVWEYYTKPEHITQWNAASEDWHTSFAENDLRIGGTFTSRMEAKDGSEGFDLTGTYNEIQEFRLIKYTMADGRNVTITFDGNDEMTHIEVTFDAESENTHEMQQAGWQAILDNFKKYVESH